MYCKNCGNKVEQNARFCPTCGAQVEQQNNYTAPQPFAKNSVDSSQNYQYQKTAFKGKQFSTGTSGSVSFGNGEKKKRGFFGKLIRLAIFGFVALVVYFVVMSFLGGPVSNIETGTGFDSLTEEIVGKTDTFSTTAPQIFVMFDINLETGTTLWVNLFYGDETMSMESFYFNVTDDLGGGYVEFTKPTGDWQVGEYTIEFVVDDELIADYTFTVE